MQTLIITLLRNVMLTVTRDLGLPVVPQPREMGREMTGACIRMLLSYFFYEESKHLNDVSSHFKLARSVLKIASIESQTFGVLHTTPLS